MIASRSSQQDTIGAECHALDPTVMGKRLHELNCVVYIPHTYHEVDCNCQQGAIRVECDLFYLCATYFFSKVM